MPAGKVKPKITKDKRNAFLMGTVSLLSLLCLVFAIYQQQLTNFAENKNTLQVQESMADLDRVLLELKNCKEQ